MTKLPFFFLLLLLLPLISGEIQTLRFSSDSQPLIKLDRFGFTHTGHVTISVSSASVHSAVGSPDLSQLGFFLLPEESKSTVQPNLSICPRSHYIDLLFTFSDLSPHSSFIYTYNVTSAGEYSLYFSNCAPQSTVSMSVRTELYNVDYRGVKDFLSAGLTKLPLLYYRLSAVYFAFSSLWIYVCARNKESVHRIHSLMAIFLVMKALNFLAEAEVLQYVKVTGTCRGWDVVFYVLQFINVAYWFALAVLEQAGWSFMQPFLQEREKIGLMIVMLLQVGACCVATISIGGIGRFTMGWGTRNVVFLLVVVICSCVVVFPLLFSIRSLMERSKTVGGKAAKNLAMLKLFRQFYVVVIVYLLVMRTVTVLRMLFPYNYKWVAYEVQEVAGLAFLAIIAYMFRPVAKFFVLDEEEEEAKMALGHVD